MSEPTFHHIMMFIDQHHNPTKDFTFSNSGKEAKQRFEAALDSSQPAWCRLDAAAEAISYLLYWFVETVQKRSEKSRAQLEKYQRKILAKVKNDIGTTPLVDLSEATCVPVSHNGQAFKHKHDRSEAERYHRVFQLMLMTRHHVSKVVTVGSGDSADRAKWKLFWKNSVLATAENQIKPKEYAPKWMQQ